MYYIQYYNRDMVLTITVTMSTMKVNGMVDREVVGVECTIVMDQYMKENGLKTKEMERVY